MTPAERWREIAGLSDHDLDLAEAALVIAQEEYRDLDVAGYLRQIAELAAALKRRLRSDISSGDAIFALNHYLFDELGFRGNTDDYYDPRNSFLNDVLDRRLGIPITLSLVYLEVGQRLGLPLRGVSFPGHFLVRCTVRDGAAVLDPYARGASLGLDDLRQRLRVLRGGSADLPDDAVRQMLAATGKKEILARMLRNLKNVYLERRDLERALSATSRLVVLDPRAAEEYRDRAALYADLECFRAALDDYEQYLALQPKAADADVVRSRLIELKQLAARIN